MEPDSSPGGEGGGCCAVPVRKRKLKSCKTTQHTLFCMNLSLDHSSSLPHSLKLYFFIEESEGSYQPPCEVFFFFVKWASCCFFSVQFDQVPRYHGKLCSYNVGIQ